LGPAQTTEPPGHKPLVVNVVVVGPFEVEEEGTGVASDVVKVEGEDPAARGSLKRFDPGTVTIPQYRANKTKQHIHTLGQCHGPVRDGWVNRMGIMGTGPKIRHVSRLVTQEKGTTSSFPQQGQVLVEH